MASATSKTTACECAFCAAEMAGELIRNQSEKLPVEGACPRLWCRPAKAVRLFAANKKGVTVFRVDRISNLVELEDNFKIENKNRFEEGEFRKRVQFMYSGELQKVKFKYSGPSLEAILDRLPTAEIKESKAGYSIIEAEAYGSGIFMWLKSQGDMIEVLER